MTPIDPTLIETLLNMSEGDTLDFKRDQYPVSGATDEQKSELVKDVLAFANGWKTTDAFIIVGADEKVRCGVKTEPIKIVIDASVTKAAGTPGEPNHSNSLAFYKFVEERVRQGGRVEVHGPWFGMLEFVVMYGRKWEQTQAAVQKHGKFEPFQIQAAYHDVTGQMMVAFLGRHATELGPKAPFTVKGGDLLYLITAIDQNCALVTNDKGLLAYDAKFCEVLTPQAFLEKYRASA